MKISELNPYALTDEQITSLVYRHVQDDLEKGDCIFVLGSRNAIKYRLPKAIQLYKEGRAKKILFSGGITSEVDTLPEAIWLRNYALAAGIPEEAILVETESKNTKENVIASLLILDRYFELHKINRLLLVTSNYHMRRTYLTAKTYMPCWIKFSLCPDENPFTKKENWFLSEKGREKVIGESRKIIRYVKRGALTDDEI